MKYIFLVAILFFTSCKSTKVETPSKPFQKEENYYLVETRNDVTYCKIVTLDKCNFVVCSNYSSVSIYPYGVCNPSQQVEKVEQ